MIWCILIPLLVGLLCAYLGYLIGRSCGRKKIENCTEIISNLQKDLESCNKSKSKIRSLEGDLNNWKNKASKFEADLNTSNKMNLSLKSEGGDLKTWKNKVEKLEAHLANANKTNLNLKSQDNDLNVWKDKAIKLEADLAASNKNKMNLIADLSACKQSKNILEAELNSTKNKVDNSLTTGNLAPFNGDAAKAIFGKKIKQDDLKLVEGIGPKIEGLFNNFGIKTWKELSEASIEKCQEVLNSGGDRYKIHNPGTWPKQAELAYKGQWAALLKWQDELDGGKA